MANSVDPDQTAPTTAPTAVGLSNLGLHCLPSPICSKTLEHYIMVSFVIEDSENRIDKTS